MRVNHEKVDILEAFGIEKEDYFKTRKEVREKMKKPLKFSERIESIFDDEIEKETLLKVLTLYEVAIEMGMSLEKRTPGVIAIGLTLKKDNKENTKSKTKILDEFGNPLTKD